jgi:phospholipase A1
MPALLLTGSVWAQTPSVDEPIFEKKPYYRTLTERWELDSASRRGTFLITPYKPMVITAGRRSFSPNEQPVSENPAYNYPFRIPLGQYEAKFLISLKVKVIQGIFGKTGDVWIGYTQRSHWQIYNTRFSRPFRETNYEPEVILNFATNFPVLGLRTRMLGLAFNHQSNGRALPLSRSWNRVIAHAGLERGDWALILRGWHRLPDTDDENPAITDHVGRGDAVLIRKAGRSLFSLAGSHTLRGGTRSRGQVQLDWTYRVFGNFKLNLQVTEGYGETLIDYNHRQTTLGISASLVEWL